MVQAMFVAAVKCSNYTMWVHAMCVWVCRFVGVWGVWCGCHVWRWRVWGLTGCLGVSG